MSEVDLAAVARAAEEHEEIKANVKELTPMQEMDIALKACGFGRFNIQLLTTAAFGFMAGVLVSASTTYVVTSAECDLHMSLVQKGFLIAASYTGMLMSTIPAGFLSDTFGRKIFIQIGFSGIFIFTVISALSQSYEVLVFAKFCEGVLFATSFNPVITLTAEYCYIGIRDRVMLLQSSFIAVSQILVALLSWGILINDWEYSVFGGRIQLHVWNFYLLICSLFSLTACILYSLIPESPRFLLSAHKYDEARNVLIKMYRENTGKTIETYPYCNIWRDRAKIQANVAKNTLSHQMVIGFKQTKQLYSKPLGPVLALICVMQFISMMTYNVIRLWYPQLSTIIEHYSGEVAEDGSSDFCVMLNAYTKDVNSRFKNNTEISTVPVNCVPTKTGAETYINTIILGCVCLAPYLVSGFLIRRIAKKYLICCCGLVVFTCTLVLRWTSTKAEMLSLFSLDVAMSQLLTSLFQTFVAEYFPTVVRSLTVAMVMCLGRLGTLLGNVLFPILLSIGCIVPFFTLAGMMLCFSALALQLPNNRKK